MRITVDMVADESPTKAGGKGIVISKTRYGPMGKVARTTMLS